MAKHNMVHDPVASVLLKMTGPMAVAMLSFLVFNVVDTFYVGQLGGDELAAMAFTFPVVFLIMSLSFGLGAGAAAVIARAAGSGDESKVQRYTTDAILLAVVLVAIVATAGFFTIDLVFGALGAEGRFLDLVREYMSVWYLGVPFVVLPMTGNNAIRALGDTKTPMKIMLTATVVNLVLDPFLIFGIGPFPRLELQGAAIATVVAFFLTFLASFWVLTRREKLITRIELGALPASWRAILRIGIPAAFTSMLTPIAAAWVTRLAAQQGPDVVAAFGVASRLEGLGLIAINALGSVMTPFMGQNLGAGSWDRIKAARAFALRFAALWGLSIAILFAVTAPFVAASFTDDAGVQRETTRLLLIIPITYFLVGWNNLAANASNGLNRPRSAVILNVVRLAAVGVLATVGAGLGAWGLYGGLAAANVVAGLFAWWITRNLMPASNSRAIPAPA